MKKSPAGKATKRGELEAAARKASAKLAEWPEWKRGGSAASAKSASAETAAAEQIAKTR